MLNADPIPGGKLAYFRGRLTNRIHALVLDEFSRLCRAGEINKAQLAKRIGRQPKQVARWLELPGNWTLETISDLLLGMGCEPTIYLKSLEGDQRERSDVKSVPAASGKETTLGTS